MTISNKKVLAVIPARIGSKGLAKKNLLKIGKHSLVERALITAINTKCIDKIVVTTDSETIQNKVNRFGDYAQISEPLFGWIEVRDPSEWFSKEPYSKRDSDTEG